MLTIVGAGVGARDPGLGDTREGVDEPKLSPPSKSVAVAPACTWEPAITLEVLHKGSMVRTEGKRTSNRREEARNSRGQIGWRCYSPLRRASSMKQLFPRREHQ